MTPDQQTIAYIAFGIAALCILILILRRPSSRRTAKNITGPVSMGDTQGNLTQTYTAAASEQPPAREGPDLHKITTLILAIIATLCTIVGTTITVLTYLNGTP